MFKHFQPPQEDHEHFSIGCSIALNAFFCFLRKAEVDLQGSDPMMSIVTPKEQYGNSYTFTTPTDGYNKAYR